MPFSPPGSLHILFCKGLRLVGHCLRTSHARREISKTLYRDYWYSLELYINSWICLSICLSSLSALYFHHTYENWRAHLRAFCVYSYADTSLQLGHPLNIFFSCLFSWNSFPEVLLNYVSFIGIYFQLLIDLLYDFIVISTSDNTIDSVV